MKDFITDDGKIRNCESNNAKMNIFEWIWYRKEDRILLFLSDSLEQFKEGSFLLLASILNLSMIIFFPITFPLIAYINIKEAKKQVAIHEIYKKQLADSKKRGLNDRNTKI